MITERRGPRARAARRAALGLALALAAPRADAGAEPRAAAVAARAAAPRALATLHWKGAERSVDDVAAELGATSASARAAIEGWAAFAAEEGLWMELTPDGRALLLVAAKRTPESELRLVTKALAHADELLAPSGGDGAKAEPWTAVLVRARDREELGRVLAHVAELEPYLASWAAGAGAEAGFVLERPLSAAWLASAPDLEEWSPENELVHRAARLAVLARYGRLPSWLELGLAWNVEEEVCGSIRCMPHRRGFVGAGEGGSWLTRLRRATRDGSAPLDVAGLAAWERGTWEDGPALAAWGTVRLVAKDHPGALAGICTDLAALREDKGVERHPDGSWRVLPDYEVAPADQEAVLRARVGEGFADELARGLRR